jgi:hypothetical protein
MCKIPDEVSADLVEAVKEMTAAIMAEIISDDQNYAVDGAVIRCDHVSEEPVVIKYENGKLKMSVAGAEISKEVTGGEYEEGYEETYEAGDEVIRTLSAVHATNQTSNGLAFATVSDSICLRDKEENGLEEEASIISTGNCKILRESDILDIETRKEKAKLFGTCYCLMKPVIEWTNPICVENLAGLHEDNFTAAGAGRILDEPTYCPIQEHHKTMEWDTVNGKREGLTRYSKLLCTRGGVITIKWSGQSQDGENPYRGALDIVELKARYGQLITDLINEYDLQMPTDHIGKIIAVESKGTGFDDVGRMLIRFEVHIFYEKIDSSKLDEANKYFINTGGSGGQQIKYGDEFVSLHPTGGLGDSDLQYLALQYAKAIDEEAAYSSISMGLCQLMGFNYETAGFSSVEEMYDRMSDSYEIQIEAMIKHIKNTGLDQGTVREFFEGYNTKQNADNYENRYDKEVW